MNYLSRCGVARFEVAWAFGSHCPRSVLGVLIAIVDSRSEWWAFEARGGKKRKRKLDYPSRCGVARFEVAWALGSNYCPRSVIGVLVTAMMADYRSKRAFEVQGGE